MGFFSGSKKVDLGNYVKIKEELCIGIVTSISNSNMVHVKIKSAVAVEEIEKTRILSIKDVDKIDKQQRKRCIKEISLAQKTDFTYPDNSSIYVGDFIEYSLGGMGGSVNRFAQILDVIKDESAPFKVKAKNNTTTYLTYLSVGAIKRKLSQKEFDKKVEQENSSTVSHKYYNGCNINHNRSYGLYGAYGICNSGRSSGYAPVKSGLETYRTATFYENGLNNPTKEFLAELTMAPIEAAETDVKKRKKASKPKSLK